MELAAVMAIVCGLLIVVGVIGVVVPVLPGSLLVAVALLVWALTVQSFSGWLVFGIGLVMVVAGMLAGAVLTGSRLKRRRIPNRSIIVGLVFAVAGLLLIPVVGLFVGFAAGLLLAEFARQRDLGAAASSSWAALKATGLGILVECGLASLAASVWVVGVWVHFAG